MLGRIIAALTAITALLAGSLVAPVLASAEESPTPTAEPAPAAEPVAPYTVTFVRDKNNCRAGTLIIKGISGPQKVWLAAGWGPGTIDNGGLDYRGTGGSGLNVWRKHFSAATVNGRPLPMGRFEMQVTYGLPPITEPWRFADLVIPPCKKK